MCARCVEEECLAFGTDYSMGYHFLGILEYDDQALYTFHKCSLEGESAISLNSNSTLVLKTLTIEH